MSFVSFLQEKKSFSSFLSRKKRKQKKVICGTVALRCCCLFREHATQNGRFTYEPSVFSFHAGHAGKRLFSDKSTVPQCLLFLFFKKRNRSLLFFLERKGSKRKSSAEQLLFAAVVFFANMLHKTDGSHTNRPFFRSMQDTRESVFSQINQLSRSVFCFFSSRKEIVPLSEEKNRPSITSTARRGSRQQPSCPRPLRGSRSQRRSQRLRPHTRTACSSCRSPHRQ